jgi:hypothetical protein
MGKRAAAARGHDLGLPVAVDWDKCPASFDQTQFRQDSDNVK